MEISNFKFGDIAQWSFINQNSDIWRLKQWYFSLVYFEADSRYSFLPEYAMR